MNSLRTVVVVGASLAGLRAAEALRSRGYGGRLILIGSEPHLPYDRPPLSKEVLRGDWEPERTALRKGGDYADLDADWRLGSPAESLDLTERSVVLAGGERIGFDGLVIATGASPRWLPGAPRLAGTYVLRSLDDALALRRDLERGPRVAVVGAGFIGAEVAASCRARGLDVTLVEALETPMARGLDPEMGALCGALHRDHGVDVRFGASVDRFEGDERLTGLVLADGARIEADCVVVGTGVRPETRWLEGSGLALDDGVVCDACLATSAPGVVAAGDAVRWAHPDYESPIRFEHWTNAVEQAAAAAVRLLDGSAEPFAPVPFVWSDQYDAKIQIAGRAHGADHKRIVHGSLEERRFVALYGRAGRLVGAVAFNRPRQLMQVRRLLREGISFEDAVARAES
jgi:3-phenylpropionate/trans-cinnamate dioxygenase ferredoxin reductase subunit